MAPETRVGSTPGPESARGRGWLAAPAICLLLLCGIATDRILFHLPVGDPGEYHARVRAAVLAIPRTIGPWEGTDEEVPQAAIDMLNPNVVLGRRYVRRDGLWAKLMIVHCQDARDMGGHYPPVCYRGQGWSLGDDDARRREWTVGDLTIEGTEYTFTSGGFDRESRIVVYNFILRPDGRIEGDLSGLNFAAYDPRKKPYGGGQVQVLFEGGVPEDERDRVFRKIVAACLPAIDTICSGVTE